MEIVEVLKALADETRIRILNVLRNETLCVCDLEAILELSQSNVSRHLTKLKSCKLITSEKQAQWVYYRIDEKIFLTHSFVKELIVQELAASLKYQSDLLRLTKYRAGGGSCESTVRINDE